MRPDYPACLIPPPARKTAGDDAREALHRIANDVGYTCAVPVTSFDVTTVESGIRSAIYRKSRQLAGRWLLNPDVADVVERLR